MHGLEKRQQVVEQRDWKRRRQKTTLDLGVIITMNCELQQIVIVEETVEHFCGQHQRGRNADAYAGKAAGDAASPENVANESQAASLAAQ